MRKLIIANWKENPTSERRALELFKATTKTSRKDATVVVCPPFVYLEEISTAYKKMTAKKNLALGVQDVFWEEKGAHTSEVGPKMVKSLGARYVIIGHSERRKYFHETDAMVNKKIKIALKDGLTVIFCVGESEAIRKKGMVAAETFIKNQLKKGLAGISSKNAKSSQLIIAYEPIWAIGSGKNDNPADAAKMARFIKKAVLTVSKVKVAVLYGGSVNSGDIRDYVQYKEIDGALVGGASLRPEEFNNMVAIVAK